MHEGVRRLPNGGVGGMQTIAKVPARQVYLFGRGQDIEGRFIDADLHDHLYQQTRGGRTKAGIEVPPDLEILCPRCFEWLHVDGHKKHIRVFYLERPVRFAHPIDGELCVQTAVVSIDEPLLCPQPTGKTVCGLKFKLTENVLHRI